MRPNRILLVLLGLVPTFACSSGLGNNIVCSTTTVGSKSGNLTTGLFFGFTPREPVTEHAAAGGLVPGTTSLSDRNVIFYAFVSEAPADDAGPSGAGYRLDRDGNADPNGEADVFVAAVVDSRIDQRAFSYSLAGKFRHPRCTSCHSLAEADTTVFGTTPHPGLPPGHPDLQDVPESATNLCMRCHRFALDALSVDSFVLGFSWRNPTTSVGGDFRKLSTFQLSQRARLAPNTHFGRDRRVLWALESGIFTQIAPEFEDNPFAPDARGIVVGGADDDHDGIDEPFDNDGRRRTVPGGRADFLTEVEAFRCGGPVDTRAAITDISLASRRTDVAQAGSGASTEPDVTYVPDDAYVPGSSGSAGTLYVAFTSTANDIVAGVAGNFTQVYRATFDVRVTSSGVNLVYQTTELVSNAGAAGGNADSHSPSISASGDRIAFASAATDIDVGGAGPVHVYVRELSSGTIERVSEGGASDSTAPAIDAGGTVVAFESNHDFDGGSASGQPDVYYAELADPFPNGTTFRRRASRPNSTGGSDNTGTSRDADVALTAAGVIFVAFSSTNDLDTSTFGDPTPTENVYVHQDNGGVRETTLVSAAQDVIGTTQLPDGDSRRPAFVGGPDRLVIETDATNLDSAFLLPPDPAFGVTTYKSGDENGGPDAVMLVLSALIAGQDTIRAEAISVSPAGAFGDGASTRPVAGGFALPATASPSQFLGFAGTLTLARNLGAADNHTSLTSTNATSWLSFVDDQVVPEGEFAAVWSVLGPRCLGCHREGSADGGFSFGNGNVQTAYERAVNGTANDVACVGAPYVTPGNRNTSLLWQVINRSSTCVGDMPPGGPFLGVDDVNLVGDWIDGGAER